MRNKILGTLFLATLIGIGTYLAVPPPRAAHANTFSPPQVQIDTAATVNITAGAQIQTPVISTASCDDVAVFADNSAGAAGRTLNIDWIAFDGTTILYRRAVTVTLATRQAVTISRFASGQAAGTNETVIGQMPGSRMQFTLTAAGAALGSLVVYCR